MRKSEKCSLLYTFRKLILSLLLMVSVVSTAQNTFSIQFPQTTRDKVCGRFSSIFATTPKEVNFSIQRDKLNNLYFEVSDKQWFSRLFQYSGDGLAIDVVPKSRYGCQEVLLDVGQIRGELLQPVYAADLLKSLESYGNRFRVWVGKLPPDSADRDLEFNILFLSNHNLCRYQTIFDLEAYQWDLLNMGMYLDSLNYTTRLSATAGEEQYTLKYKKLTFTVPFEKNKSRYSPEDIKPLYDSLRLTDFTIAGINIKAYSSVEGNLARNKELQEQRAESIITALQSFQKPTMRTSVSSSENWVEFLNDIRGSSYDDLKSLSKDEISTRVVGQLADELEIYLKDHRKAVITLELEKKDPFKDQSAVSLLEKFNDAIAQNELDRAVVLQNSLFEKLKNKEADPDILNLMEIPRQVIYVPFLTKNSAMLFLLDEGNMLIAYNQLLELEKLAPGDSKIKYNLMALKLTLWHYNVQPFDGRAIEREIGRLQDYGIDPELIERMYVNFHIVKSEILMRQRDFYNKDFSVDYIVAHYKNFPLTAFDFLSLSQYLSYYSNIDKAVSVLQDKVMQIDVEEDLLFFYLNLTLIDRVLTSNPYYRTIMLNAINMNNSRFCKLFNAFGNGGVTFQLLEDDFLRDTYCENCTK